MISFSWFFKSCIHKVSSLFKSSKFRFHFSVFQSYYWTKWTRSANSCSFFSILIPTTELNESLIFCFEFVNEALAGEVNVQVSFLCYQISSLVWLWSGEKIRGIFVGDNGFVYHFQGLSRFLLFENRFYISAFLSTK